jgi:hypothetical protein
MLNVTSKVVSTILSTELKYLLHNIWVCCRMENTLAGDTEWSISGTWNLIFKEYKLFSFFSWFYSLHNYQNTAITCKRSLSSACITAWDQSITSAKGRRHPLESKTGTQPARRVSMNRKEPSRLPRGTRQNVEFWRRES